MKDWSFVVKRRKTTLEFYLKEVDSIEGALEKFRKNNIIPPPLTQIAEVLGVKTEDPPTPKSQPIKGKKKTTAKGTKKKASIEEETRGIDEIVIIDTEDTFED